MRIESNRFVQVRVRPVENVETPILERDTTMLFGGRSAAPA